MEKILDEMPSYRKLYHDLQSMKVLAVFGNNEIKKTADELEKKFNRLVTYSVKFNNYFPNNGWILYDSISSKVVEEAVNQYENNGLDAAERILTEYYRTDWNYILPKLRSGNEELKLRYSHITTAYNDHIDGRYHASIPQFLMIIDGVVNGYTKRKGFFAEETSVDAWDCLVGSSDGLQKLKKIYNKSRQKTTVEPIYLPYRNGILHGRDLNYANEIVSCKCIVLLLAVRDWMIKKSSETIRKEKYEKAIKVPTWTELLQQLKNNADNKKRIQSWEKTEILIDRDIPRTDHSSAYSKYSYIQRLVEALETWKDKNYGKLAQYFSYLFNYESNINLRPKECRQLFQNKEFLNFELVEIEDRAISLKRVLVEVRWMTDNDIYTELLEFGINYQNENGESAIPPEDNGEWIIIPWKVQGLYKC